VIVDGLIRVSQTAIKRPVAAAVLTFFGALGYFNLFFFGFWIGVPNSLRPFLDGYFFASLTGEFLVAVAVSSITARALVLFLRYLLLKYSSILSGYARFFNLPYIIGSGIVSRIATSFVDRFFKPFDLGRFVTGIDRKTNFRLKIIARWLRRKRLLSSIALGAIIFAVIFLGWHVIWYVPALVMLAPLMWACISTVELRRDFANYENTKQMSVERVYFAIVSFVALYLGAAVFIAGVACYQHRFDAKVSLVTSDQSIRTSLIAVTSAGVIVGDRSRSDTDGEGFFYFSASFVPYSELSSVNQ
jgi:hypothetical protein